MMQMYGSSNIFYMLFDGPFKGEHIHTVRLMYPDQYGTAGGLGTVGNPTTWFRDQLGFQELEAQKAGGENAFSALAKLSLQSTIGSNGLVALPYFSGERNPIFDGLPAACSSASTCATPAPICTALCSSPSATASATTWKISGMTTSIPSTSSPSAAAFTTCPGCRWCAISATFPGNPRGQGRRLLWRCLPGC